ncbi:MAG TPA: sigma-70 family RNA polymerase sigma factor [Bacteroidia bacterium]
MSSEAIVKNIYNNRRPICKWVKMNNGSSEDADDVMQEAIIIYLNLLSTGRMNMNDNPMPMVTVIAKRYWISKLRKDKRDFQMMTDELMKVPIDDDLERALNREKSFNDMEKVLNQIGEKCKQLLNLFYYKKASLKDIATELDFRNEQVAKVMKFKCLEKARELFKNQNKQIYE